MVSTAERHSAPTKTNETKAPRHDLLYLDVRVKITRNDLYSYRLAIGIQKRGLLMSDKVHDTQNGRYPRMWRSDLQQPPQG